jgi:hypothetical protein
VLISGSPDYKALFLREKRRNQHTTFSEFIRACHTLLSTSLKVETTSRSTYHHHCEGVLPLLYEL